MNPARSNPRNARSETLQRMAVSVMRCREDGPAIAFEGNWHSWSDVRRVAKTVLDLTEHSGAPARAPVLFFARNQPAAIAALLGLIAAGRTVRFLYSFLASAAIAQQISLLRPGVVVASERDFADDIREALRQRGAAAIALGAMNAFTLPGLEKSCAEPDPEAPAIPTLEIQTSGTTGPPKRFPVAYEVAHRHFVERLTPPNETGGAGPLPALLYMPLEIIPA
jgi:long-chain acyl-CoA synthetase